MFLLQDDRLEDDWVPTEDTRELEEIERETREQEARNKAVVLEMIGDLPEADAKPPPNMLFICKLNPVTTEEVLLQDTPGVSLDVSVIGHIDMGHANVALTFTSPHAASPTCSSSASSNP